MQILLAFDKFKGSLSAKEACEIAAQSFRGMSSEFRVTECPIADGGDGTLDVLEPFLGGERRRVLVENAVSTRKIPADFLLTELEGQPTAVIELASASGLAELAPEERNPMTASTYGTGQLMEEAIRQGARHLIIALGGSATNDGGVGIAEALGFRFINSVGEDVMPLPARLNEVTRIIPPNLLPPTLKVTALADVNNPLLGSQGATRIFGRQKGVNGNNQHLLEDGLSHLVSLAEQEIGRDPSTIPGAGAAGGAAYGLMTFLNASLKPGFEYISNLIGLSQKIQEADWVIVGEGCLDQQTLSGKAPYGISQIARSHGKPVIAIAGLIENDAREMLEEAFTVLRSLTDDSMPLEESMSRARELLQNECFNLKSVLEPVGHSS